MLVAIDTGVLSLWLHPDAKAPNDPKTGKPLDRCKDRIEKLIEDLDADGSRVLIPAPVLAEFLVMADKNGDDYLLAITDKSNFEIVPFDMRAAVEAAASQRKAIHSGNKKGDLAGSRQCVKADRQITAIARVYQVDQIYTADTDIQKLAQEMKVQCTMVWDLPVPPEKQEEMDFEKKEDEKK